MTEYFRTYEFVDLEWVALLHFNFTKFGSYKLKLDIKQ